MLFWGILLLIVALLWFASWRVSRRGTGFRIDRDAASVNVDHDKARSQTRWNNSGPGGWAGP